MIHKTNVINHKTRLINHRTKLINLKKLARSNVMRLESRFQGQTKQAKAVILSSIQLKQLKGFQREVLFIKVISSIAKISAYH